MDRRTEPLREEIAQVVEPARSTLAEIEGLLAHEVSLMRGYLLSGDEQFLERYHEVRDRHQQLYGELQPLAERLGPEVQARFAELRALAERRRAPVEEFLRGEITREEFAARLPTRQQLFEEALSTAERLKGAIIAVEQQHRQRISELRQLNRWLTLALVLLALIAAGVVIRIGQKIRGRTQEEMSLRRVAHALTGALSIDQILRWIAANAQPLARADGVYVERADAERGEVEVVAVAGENTPAPRTRVPYPGSLSREMLEAADPQPLADASGMGQAMASHVAESCPGCSALVVPLVTSEQVLGALVLLRGSGRPQFTREEMVRAFALADLASLAMRKVLLLEEAQKNRAELAQLIETRTRLIRGISHDLKNPLGAADGYAALLEEGVKGELTEEQLDFIRRSLRSTREIISNLLDFARAETGNLSLQSIETNTGRLIREVAEDYQGMAEMAGVERRANVPEDLPVVRTDPVRFREILGNLLSNAVKYTPEGGCIHVAAGVRSEDHAAENTAQLVVSVADSGPGIPEAEQETIFEEFHRLNPQAARGAGIGLAISRKVARLLGGDITVESEVGKGSTFRVWLPYSPDRESRPEPSRQELDTAGRVPTAQVS